MLQESHELFLGADERGQALKCVLWSQRRHVFREPTMGQIVREIAEALAVLAGGAEP